MVLFQQDGRTAIPAAPLPGAVGVTTVTGDGQMQMAMVSRFKLGQHTLWDQPAVLLQVASSPGGDQPDGLLPLSLFAEVTFNGPERYLIARR